MRYDRFIELREDRWSAFADELGRLSRKEPLSHAELESLSVDYRKILHDHALATSRFEGTWAAKHLQQLVLRGNHALRHHPDRERFRLGHFYRSRFPEIFREHRAELLVAVSLFVVAAVLGLTMTIVQPGVGVGFIGAQAVEGLQEGRLWTEVIDEEQQHATAAGLIARNNMAVALIAWGGGILAGTLSLWVVLVNGFMLGSVIGVTLHFQMQGKLLEFISAHGPLELTLILVAAAAGLKVGRALVTAGERPRSQRVGEAALGSLGLVLGCLPFFLLLGLVEGFVSPAASLSLGFKVGVGLSLEALFLMLVLRRGSPREPSAGALEGTT